MTHITTRVNSAQNTDLLPSKLFTNSLDDYLDAELLQSLITEDSVEPLPRFKLIALPGDELGAFELELLAKADKWHIPYNKETPDFCALEDEVYSYESLIKQTVGTDINWDYSFYDPVGLEQAISDMEEREGGYSRAAHWDYYATKGVS